LERIKTLESERESWIARIAKLEAENAGRAAETAAAIANAKQNIMLEVLTAISVQISAVQASHDNHAARLESEISQIKALTPQKGDPGEPGKDWPGEDYVREIAAQAAHDSVTEKMAGFPPIPKGDPGEPGKDADEAAITAAILEKVMAKVAEIPVPKNGEPGEPGKDGVGLAGALIDRDGQLVVTLTDGTAKQLGPVVGKDGDPGEAGKNGVDALGFDDLDIEFDGERTFKFVMARGDVRKEFGPYSVPAMIWRGLYVDGKEYKQGDTVTWAGCLWVCQKDSSDKPDNGSGDWKMAVRKGRDGKDGVMKPAAEHKPVSIGK
jgi:hypothetical protein